MKIAKSIDSIVNFIPNACYKAVSKIDDNFGPVLFGPAGYVLGYAGQVAGTGFLAAHYSDSTGYGILAAIGMALVSPAVKMTKKMIENDENNRGN